MMESIKLQSMKKCAGKIRWRRGFLPLLFFLFLAGFPSNHAYCFVQRLENSELVARSHLVIYGVVKEIHPKDDGRVALVVAECVLKGRPPGKEVRVIFSPGMAESPLFEIDEGVLLFLTETASGLFQTVGGFQGKFSFGKSAKGE